MRLHGILDLFMMAKLAEKIPMIMVYGRYMELVLGEFGRPMNDITGHHLVSTWWYLGKELICLAGFYTQKRLNVIGIYRGGTYLGSLQQTSWWRNMIGLDMPLQVFTTLHLWYGDALDKLWSLYILCLVARQPGSIKPSWHSRKSLTLASFTQSGQKERFDWQIGVAHVHEPPNTFE